MATVEEIMDNPTDGSETETSEENDSYDLVPTTNIMKVPYPRPKSYR